MWCKNCRFEVNERICPVCGAETVEEIPTEIFWCENCAVPVINSISAENRNILSTLFGKDKTTCRRYSPDLS